MVKLDDIDLKILNQLIDDAKKAYTQIAKDLGISNTLVHQRIAKMRDAGIIDKMEVKLNPKVLGFDTFAYMGIILKDTSRSMEVVDKLKEIPEIIECSYVTGNYSFLLKVMVRNNGHLRDVFERLDNLKEIQQTETMISFGFEFQKNFPIHLLEKEIEDS
ncbi:Lrp/AsnC ligand binding domain-containing protein [Membranihabitans maritimus]|uniref:Lrp/AsnC ligand binding domain-containing protein n=1 Tax=Membranihabitans maritimus TaxID=2904244 RepID=UPI001F1CE36B|nr:Lrp/AsnC ligand binding domain-containing protein [Membranihabitans maritimus]